MVFIGFVVRVLYISLAHSYKFRTTDANFSFGWELGRIAYSLANGHGFSSPFGGDTGPSAWHAPIYPWVVSIAFRIFGSYTHAASFALLTFNSLCAALTCWPVYRIARRIFGETIAAWSGWIWALLPYIIYWSVRQVWETSLTTLLFTIAFMLTVEMEADDRIAPWIGFGVLSLGIGALQLMLDRGELKGWFGATEIIIEATLAGLGLYLFIVHEMLAEQPFIPPRIFRDLNFSASLLVMFAIGLVLLASATLLAPYLQTDPRLIMLLGFAMIAESMREMTGWTPDVDAWSLARTTLLQGAGLGFVFIPLQVIAFATLPADLRTDGTALFSLVRNVGNFVGISITSALLAQNTQIVHTQLTEYVTPFNRLLQTGGAYLLWNNATPAGLGALNAEITRQASMIAYIDDFKFMVLICLPAAALLLLMRRPPPLAAAADHLVIPSAQEPTHLRHTLV